MRHPGVSRPPGGRPPWWLARGIHRTIVGFLLLATLIGGVGGAALVTAARLDTPPAGLACVAVATLLAVWPLAWVATFRIAWPLRNVARVAAELRGGRLASRDSLPTEGGEVGEVADALRDLADRLARQLAAQRALLATVSHELRSPLARARVLVELGRDGGDAPHATWADELQAEIGVMDGIVGDLLATARIDFEAIAPVPIAAIDLAARARALSGAEAPLVDESEGAAVEADPTLLARAIGALLDNARRHAGGAARLVVRARVHRVRFEVEDDGPGFAAGDEERAFAPFWRARGGADGVGLGLALVRRIAEAQGGEAGAANRAEGGARVWIELPRATRG